MTQQVAKQLFLFIFATLFYSFVINEKTNIKKVQTQITEYESTIEEFEDTIQVVDVFRPYAISEAGKNFIKSTESLSLISYWDVTGYAVGYGHHGNDICKNMRIDSVQANKFFDEDMEKIEKSVERLIKGLPYEYNFSQGFIDGLSSLVYNCGEGGVKGTEFYQRLKNCRVKNGVMNKEDWNYTLSVVKETKVSLKGHITRRQHEYAMMIK